MKKLFLQIHSILIAFIILCSCNDSLLVPNTDSWLDATAIENSEQKGYLTNPIFYSNGVCFYLEDTIAVIAPSVEILHGFRVIETNFYRDSVVIPTFVHHNGKDYPVRKVGTGAFSSAQYLSHLIIPEGIVEIENGAFSYSAVKSINIPSTTISIGIDAFQNCKYLEKIIISEDNNVYCSVPDEVVIVDKRNSKLFRAIHATYIPSFINSIGSGAFNGLDYRSLIIPENVSIIEPGAFLNCSIDSIIIHPNNISFDTTPGINCIVEEQTGRLIVAARKFKNIPDYVKEICSDAFRGVDLGDSIILNDNLNIIGDRAFFGHNFTAIHIPANVSKIGVKAFAIDESVDSNRLTSLSVDNCNRHFESPEGTNVIIRKSDKSLILGCSKSIIPKGIKIIGYGAFQACTMSNINIPEGVVSICDSAFIDCCELTELQLPKSLKSLGNSAFQRCRLLSKVDLPDDLLELGDYCFCLTDIDSIDIPNKVAVIGDNAFSSTKITNLVIPEGVAVIGKNSFYSTPLKSVRLPETLLIIDEGAFWDCEYLSEIELPQSLKYIGGYAFCNTAIDHIDFGAFIEVIGNNAFSTCKNIKYVQIPENVKKIGDCAFYGCPLDSVSVHENNNYYYSNGCNVIIDKQTNRLITGSTAAIIPIGVKTIAQQSFFCINIEQLYIPESVTKIEESAFYGCKLLTEINMPSTITAIGKLSFCYCSSLQNLNISISIDSIPEAAFLGCTSLDRVFIPEGVNMICNNAFQGCANLKYVEIPSTVTHIGKDVFKNCGQLTKVVNKSDIQLESIHVLKTNTGFKHSMAKVFTDTLPSGEVFIYE